ncbi:MAG: hypothetical protein GF401_13205 [Chitinivibrionales bacterium]|nr:hypothetical protein [Chitinivibrionales bacterium]
MKKIIKSDKGITLLGLLIAVVIGGLVLMGLMRVFIASVNSYSTEEKLIDMKHTSYMTMNKIKEFFMEAGVDLPEDEDVITFNGDYVTIKVNRSAAYHAFDAALDTNQAPVEDARGFIGYQTVWKKTPGQTPEQYSIDISQNTPPWEKGVDTTNDAVYLAQSVSFAPDDELYAYKTYSFKHDPSSAKVYMTVDGYEDILADNISEFMIKFYDTHKDSKVEKTDWADMRVCSLRVVGKTSSPVGMGRGEVKETALTKMFYLRNKIPVGSGS